MKIYQNKCPSCGASIEINKDKEFCVCEYCREKIYWDDDVKRIEINKKIDYHKTYTDEAKIREIELEEKIFERNYTKDREKQNKQKWSIIASVLPIIIISIIFITIYVSLDLYFDSLREESDKQEQELQTIVNEVIVDIGNGDFANAYIKAETLYYTEGWSSEIEEKWDSTREELIKQIKKAEKEAKKNRKTETWWNPFD